MEVACRVKRIGFIGAGTVGTTLAMALHRAAYPVVAVASRRFASAQALADRVTGCAAFPSPQAVADRADLVFITTPDDAIAEVVAAVTWRPGQGVVHTSGAVSLDVLAGARKRGAWTGSVHPLQTFADPEQGLALLPGSTFALEGDAPILPLLHALVEALGGRPLVLPPAAKTVYHIAAVLVSNYTVTLAKLATDLWATFGIAPDVALEALVPLLQGTSRNLQVLGLPAALTGPIARGDVGTVRRHLEALADRAPALLDVYRSLGRQTVPIAVAKGRLSPEAAAVLEHVLSSPVADGEAGLRPQEDEDTTVRA